jgi:hypothetical protein
LRDEPVNPEVIPAGRRTRAEKSTEKTTENQEAEKIKLKQNERVGEKKKKAANLQIK